MGTKRNLRKLRRDRIERARQGYSNADLAAISRTVRRAKDAIAAYKEIKCSEIHAFLFHFDLLWEGSGYLPRHVSEAMDRIQKAVETSRAVLEGYVEELPVIIDTSHTSTSAELEYEGLGNPTADRRATAQEGTHE